MYIQERKSNKYENNKGFRRKKSKKLLEGTPKEVFSKIDTLKNIGLDVPCMTELSNLLKSEGLDIRDDILTVDEMVMELCQL